MQKDRVHKGRLWKYLESNQDCLSPSPVPESRTGLPPFYSLGSDAERKVQKLITFLFLPIFYSKVILLLQKINYATLLLT